MSPGASKLHTWWKALVPRRSPGPAAPSPCSVHRDLTLEEFKRIFHMEYTHRMWGRLTGVAFLVPAAIFFARGWVTPYLRPRLLVQGGLLVFQVGS